MNRVGRDVRMTIKDVFRPQVRELKPYRVELPSHTIKLNQNESPYDLPARMKTRILGRMRSSNWTRYPDYPPDRLTELLARRHRVSPARVLVGHGSNELIQTLCLASLGEKSRLVLPAPSFPLFNRMGLIQGAVVRTVHLGPGWEFPVEELSREAADRRVGLVIIASPNNPTGGAISLRGLRQILRSTRALVAVDGAYAEFCRLDYEGLLGRHVRLVILRTFSKAFGLAGLRLGYILGHPRVVEVLEAVKTPHSVDAFAQAAAETVMEEPDCVIRAAAVVIREREKMMRELSRLPGVEVFPSQANFVLIRVGEARRTWLQLLRKGILVRDVSRGPLLEGCLRITIGRPRENAALVRAMREAGRGG